MKVVTERWSRGEFISSLTRFCWAISLFGAEQLAKTIPGRSNRPGATAAFSAVTRATEDQFGAVLKTVFRGGDELQRRSVDLIYNAATLEALSPRTITKMTFDVMQKAAESISLLVPARESRFAWQEVKNRLQAFSLFEHVDSLLQLPVEEENLAELVKQVDLLESYSAVWATEGLGHYFTDTSWHQGEAPRTLLKSWCGELHTKSLAPLHAGMGLAIANRLLETIRPRSSEKEIRQVLEAFVELCKNNSCEGYFGVACEALGLATRNLYPHLITSVDRQLSESHEELLRYFWHGVGRGIYFAPSNSLPGPNSKQRALKIALESPHNLGRQNALAGLVWAITLVNIREPEILESFVAQNIDRLPDKDAFTNGVSSAVMIWRDSTGGDRYLDAFCRYQPRRYPAGLTDNWERLVRRPCLEALQSFYPVLKEHRRLGEVFCYGNLSSLVQRLESDPGRRIVT